MVFFLPTKCLAYSKSQKAAPRDRLFLQFRYRHTKMANQAMPLHPRGAIRIAKVAFVALINLPYTARRSGGAGGTSISISISIHPRPACARS
jgi:hypothetical protein